MECGRIKRIEWIKANDCCYDKYQSMHILTYSQKKKRTPRKRYLASVG